MTAAVLIQGKFPAGEGGRQRCPVNLAGIDFVSVRLVVLCADRGSLSAAARQGHLSLSSASHRLAHLEDLFGARLFERDHRGLRPTAAGEIFVLHAREILETLNGLGMGLASLQFRGSAQGPGLRA